MASASLAGAQTISNAATFVTLHIFGTNGANPVANLILSGSTLFGTTRQTTDQGGTNDGGTVFSVNTNGTGFTVLHNFTGATNDGAYPYASLILSGSTLYGTTLGGGTYSDGTAFSINTNGTGFTVLYNFTGTNDGANPYASLILSGSTLFGTTQGGGTYNEGTVFSINTNGTGFTVLHNFTGATNDGANPYASLILSGSTLYGTAAAGGTYNEGTVFSINTNGTGLTVLHNFTGTTNDGANPEAGLVLSGSTLFGTAYGHLYPSYPLTVFSISTNGTGFNVLYHSSVLAYLNDQIAGLVLSGSTLFGTICEGGTNFDGAVFSINTNGTGFNVLYNFTDSTNDGAQPFAGLVLSGSTLFGTTEGGWTPYLSGTIFSVSLSSPTITSQPTSRTDYAGSTVMFNVTATSLFPMSYQWQKNGTNLVDGGNVSGSVSNVLTLANISDADAAVYSINVGNFGSLTSSNATLTVIDLPFIATQPLSQAIGVGSNVTFTALAYGAPPFIFQWYYDNSPVGSPTAGTNVSSYTLTNVQTNQSGSYSVQVINGDGSVVSSNAVLTVLVFPPSIAIQPSSQSPSLGSSVSFTVSVNGTPPFQYQWQFKGTNIPGATNVAYNIPAVGTNDTGNYSVAVTNSAGGVMSSNALLTVIVPPSIAIQPASQSPSLGGSASFTISVSGTPPFQYQWQFKGTNILDATNAAYTIPVVGTNDAGNYSVAVTNSAGGVTSSNALLTVLFLPSITTQPISQKLVLGSAVSFNVAVSGTAPFNYQWLFNSVNILNATNGIYEIQAVSTNNTGIYSVIVTNLAGSVTSSNALLTVLVPPALSLHLLAGYPVLDLNGMLGNDFVVQYNTNLADANWINLLSLSNLSSSPYLFLDPAGTVPPARFYRAFMQ